MPPPKVAQSSNLAVINIQDQLNATHNPSFPFSSPNLDDRTSFRSGRTGNTNTSRALFGSSNSSSTELADYESGGTSDHDEWHLERYSQDTEAQTKLTTEGKAIGARRRARPGLQIITDFSKPTYHANNILIDHVQAKQAQTRRNKAHSVMSQRGVRVDPETPKEKNDYRLKMLTSLKDLVQSNKYKRQAVIQPRTIATVEPRSTKRSPSGRSILIGLRVPEEEARTFKQNEFMDSAVTLHTPATPAIILTPPMDKLVPEQAVELTPAMPLGQQKVPSSIYSAKAHNKSDHKAPSDALPPPYTFADSNSGSHALMSRNPFRKESATGLHSSAEVLDDGASSANTARPLSQGWWNLMLSPMLSRAGSVVSRIGRDIEGSPPPVPAIPTNFGAPTLARSPESRISPETPRRLGLASPEGSSWTTWTEWTHEHDITLNGDDVSQNGKTKEKVFPTFISNEKGREGLAAEYFHACAVEQLAGISYFECVGHSCAQKWPRLHSGHDTKGDFTDANPRAAEMRERAIRPGSHRGLAILGTPFDHSSNGAERGVKVRVNDALQDGHDTDEEEASDKVLARITKRASIGAKSSSTPIESDEEPDELSPNVRKADMAAVVRARALGSSERLNDSPAIQWNTPRSQPVATVAAVPAATNMQPQKTQRTKLPKDLESTIPDPVSGDQQIRSVAPLTSVPDTGEHTSVPQRTHQAFSTSEKAPGHRSLPDDDTSAATSKPFVPPQEYPYPPPPRQLSANHIFFHGNSSYPEFPNTVARASQSVDTDEKRLVSVESDESDLRKSASRKQAHSNFLTSCFRKKKDGPKASPEKRKKKRCICLIAFVLLAIVVVCVVLAMLLVRHGDGTPVDSRWLNLTGYPPMPTGISTIAQPDLTKSVNQCVSPSTLWSCSLPKEDQATVAPNDPNQPNFRFEIKFRNGTTPANMTVELHKRANDPFTDDLFTPNPAAPNQADQIFLGQTTDNVTAPFDGEITPFYISFLSTFPVVPSSFNVSKRLASRQAQNLDDNIPPPSQADDGTAAPANLLPNNPFPAAQPIRLYNRGLQDEHYGFYMYYSKSIFLSGIAIVNGEATASTTPLDADQNGGSTKSAASVRCTWQQTRFLVRMYTNRNFDAVLLDGPKNTTTSITKDSNKPQNGEEASSAVDFSRPGSFPYPTTLIIDRHGGNINTKIAFCYGMSGERINVNDKNLVFEDRTFGGTLINAAPAFVQQTNGTSGFNTSAGGIDGGTGGCGCTWQNWR